VTSAPSLDPLPAAAERSPPNVLVRAPRPPRVDRPGQGRLGIPAVLYFILSAMAPMTVAAGVVTTLYAVTGLSAIGVGADALAGPGTPGGQRTDAEAAGAGP
jgi:hypothetical protein